MPFMKKTVSVCLIAALLFLVSCNGSTPEVSSSAAAPVPVFLSGMSAQPRSAESDGQPQDNNLLLMYKYMIGGFALVGFNGTTSSIEISDVDVLGTSVDFTWREENGVFTYDGAGEDMAIVIKYDTERDLVDIFQVSKGSAYNNDYYFIVFKAESIEYDDAAKTLDGPYTAYLTGAENISPDDFFLVSIGYGYAHSDENATGVLVTEMENLGTMSGDIEGSIEFKKNPDTDIETGNELIIMMEEKNDNVEKSVNLQVLYTSNGKYTQLPENGAYDSMDYLSEIKNQLNPVSSQWSDTLDDLFPDTSQQYL